jgi:hypothetical protein
VDDVGAVDFWGFEAIEGVGGSDGCAGGEEGEEEEVFHAEGGKGMRLARAAVLNAVRTWSVVFMCYGHLLGGILHCSGYQFRQ